MSATGLTEKLIHMLQAKTALIAKLAKLLAGVSFKSRRLERWLSQRKKLTKSAFNVKMNLRGL